MTNKFLDSLVESGMLKSYKFSTVSDGESGPPADRLDLEFPNDQVLRIHSYAQFEGSHMFFAPLTSLVWGND